MKPFYRKAFAHLPALNRSIGASNGRSKSRRRHRFRRQSLALLLSLGCAVPLGLHATLALAQSEAPAAPNSSSSTETFREGNINESKERSPNGVNLPNPPVKGPEVAAPPSGDPYVLEFNRSPVVGKRFSLRGIYDEARLGFTRPRDWKIKTVKAQIRYRHSPARTQDPFDPPLWTEILPDSKIAFDFAPQPISLDFNRFPYPIFYEPSLFPNQIAY